MTAWYEEHIGKPWVAAPRPPQSFNCGELARSLYREHLGLELAAITANAASLRECVENMRPEIFGLKPLFEDEDKRDFDIVFFARGAYEDHCGLAAITRDGLLILHCLQGTGVVLERPMEALARGFKRLFWYRHKEMD